MKYLKIYILFLLVSSVISDLKAQNQGKFDTSFISYTGFRDVVNCGISDNEGGWIAGGYFSSYDYNKKVFGLVRLDANNNVDTMRFNGFEEDADVHTVTAITKLQDGSYIVGGAFLKYDDKLVGSIMKLDSSGRIDTTFNNGLIAFDYSILNLVYSVTECPDGKLMVACKSTVYNGAIVQRIFRINSNGSIDPTFSTNLTSITAIHDVVFLPDSSMIVAGSFSHTQDGITKYDIAKLKPNGLVDTAFHLVGTGLPSSASYNIHKMDWYAEDKLMIVGNFASFNGIPRQNIAVINTDGTVDMSFVPVTMNFTDIYNFMVEDDKIIFVGNNMSVPGYSGNMLALNHDGSHHPAFPVYSSSSTVYGCFQKSNGKLIVYGGFIDFGSRVQHKYVQLLANGSFDDVERKFNGTNEYIYSAAANQDGTYFVGGNFLTYDKFQSKYFIKLNSNGSVDTSFDYGSGFSNFVRIIKRQNDGKVIVQGDFTSYKGSSKKYFVRLYGDGTIDPLFNIGSGPVAYTTNSVKSISLYPNGKILVAGNFASFNGTVRKNMVRLFSNGSVDLSFIPANLENINSTAILSDNRIIVAGSFNTVNDLPKNGIARLNVNGSLDNTFNTGTGCTEIFDCAVTADNKIIIVGDFITYNGIPATRIARLLSDGSLDTSFHSGSGANLDVNLVEVLPSNQILIAGDFTTYNGVAVGRIALLDADGTLNTEFQANVLNGFTDSPTSLTLLAEEGKILTTGGNTNYSGFLHGSVCKLFGPDCESVYDTVEINIIEGETYTLPDGIIVSESGVYNTFTNIIYECDSVLTTIVNVEPLPCLSPSGIAVSNITSNSAKLSWESADGATQYNIWYRKTGVATWTKKNAPTLSKTLTGLNPSTTYQYKIRTKCDTEYSDFSGLSTFTTLPLKESENSLVTEPIIYPNPNSGNFTISLPNADQSYKLSIIDVSGRIVFHETYSSGLSSIEIALPSLESGVYFVSAAGTKNVYCLKFIIK